MPAPPRRGRPPLTSRAAILDAVLEIGLDRATTSAVAERLGVDQSTLYRHISSREEMLDAAVGVAASRAVWPDPGEDWAQYLRDCAQAMWTMFASTPGLAQRVRGMTSMPEAFVLQAYRVVEHLTVALGFSLREAALIVDTIGDMTADSYLTIELLDRPVDDGRTFRQLAIDTMTDAGGAAPDAAMAHEYLEVLREAMGGQGSPSAWWTDKVELVIDGVRQRLHARTG
ncbi:MULTISPECIES: TetR/AcrR family transcriptional regulator [unclassified Microbacterium]|uniref:TetR/AcrR family transcriptional regulator n=1 Tax=unclassified Microbacterium TaxID=2609290 RepID=UPI003017A7DE